MRKVLVLSVFVLACGDDGGGGGDLPGGATGASDDGDDGGGGADVGDDGGATGTSSTGTTGCPEGHLDCSCVEGTLCLGGLDCDDGVCVPAPDETGGGTDTGGEKTGTGGGTDTGGDGGGTDCSSNTECGDFEACWDGSCYSTDRLYFKATVEYYLPPDCIDGFGTKELYFDYYHGGIWEFSSPNSGCPGTWANRPFVYDSLKAWKIAFWEDDAFADDHQITICWFGPNPYDGDPDECDPVPAAMLHAGSFMSAANGHERRYSWEPCGFFSSDCL